MIILIEEGDPRESFDESAEYSIRHIEHRMRPQPGYHGIRQGKFNNVDDFSPENLEKQRKQIIEEERTKSEPPFAINPVFIEL